MNNRILIILLLSLSFTHFADASSKVAYKLLRKLFRGYSRTGPPKLSPNDTTEVKLGFHVQHIDLDESKQILETSGYLLFYWLDDYMKWNPSEFEGLETLRVPAYYVWKPDVDIYNGKSEGLDRSRNKADMLLHNSGHLVWVPKIKINTYCSLNHEKFPYDEQKCNIYFGSWTYSKSSLDLHPLKFGNGTGLISFSEMDVGNPTWALKNASYVRNVLHFSDDSYVDIKATLVLKRNFVLYSATIVTPMSIAAFLALLMFLLPPWHSQRLMPGAISAVILILVLIHLAWILPPTLSVPKIVTLCRTTFIAVCASLCCSTILMNVSRGNCSMGFEPPAFLINILEGILGKICCINGNSENPAAFGHYRKGISPNSDSDDKAYLSDPVVSNRQKDEWKLVALAVDRLLLIVFAITFIVTTIR